MTQHLDLAQLHLEHHAFSLESFLLCGKLASGEGVALEWNTDLTKVQLYQHILQQCIKQTDVLLDKEQSESALLQTSEYACSLESFIISGQCDQGKRMMIAWNTDERDIHTYTTYLHEFVTDYMLNHKAE